MSNPFRDQPVADAEPTAPEAASVFETPEAVEVDADAEAEVDESYGKFEDPEAPKQKPSDQATVPQKRLAQVVRQRNELRETLAEKEARLAAAEARAETLAELSRVVDAHYSENPGLLDFDAKFMSLFDQMAKTDVQIAAVAQRIKAAMSGEEAPVIDETPEKEVVEEAASNPVIDKIVARDVNRTVAEVLGEHGVKPHFVKLIAADVLSVLDPTELADMTPEDVVEIAKVYVHQNDIPMTEFLTPKPGAKAPATTSGRSTPARNSAPAAADPADERVKPKTVEEWEANRNKRFKSLARDLGF